MEVFTYSEARQHFASVLDKALNDDVIIRRRDGNQFRIAHCPVSSLNSKNRSPLDIPGVDSGITLEQTLSVLHDIREDAP
jgi:hypothetical protein